MATPEMLAAVSAAVKGEAPAPETPEVPATPEAAAPAQEAPAAEEKPDLIGKRPEPEAPVEVEEPAGAEPARGPDGKFVAKAAKEEGAAEPETPEEPEVAAEPEKPVDLLNDPLPEGKKERGERYQALVGMVKEKTAELETIRQDYELIMAPINESGASAEQFRDAMNLVKLLNSPHQHDQMAALQYLQGAGSALAQRLGQPVPGADPLEGFNDLIAEVNAGKLTEQRAAEIAHARRTAAASQRFQQTAQQRTQQEQARQNEVQAGTTALRSVEETLAASDPQYKAKMALLRADAAFVSQMQQTPPSQWAAKFAEKYRTVRVAAPAAPAPAASARPASQTPLRSKNPAGTNAKPPGSMLEAVRGALTEQRAG